MATIFQVRLAGEEATYAAQAARALFDEADRLEGWLSRFKASSDISAIARLQPGETLRLNEATCECLALAREMELATEGTFSITAAARQTQPEPPQWTLDPGQRLIRCEAGRLEFDLGAIGKGFALDRMALELADWECPAFLLVAGGSSILAGEPPAGIPGWSVGLGEDNSEPRQWLKKGSLSGSGVAVKGHHILDPRTGEPAKLRDRAWAMSPSAAVSDALSTAFMVLTEPEINRIMRGRNEWQAFLNDDGKWRQLDPGGQLAFGGLAPETMSGERASGNLP